MFSSFYSTLFHDVWLSDVLNEFEDEKKKTRSYYLNCVCERAEQSKTTVQEETVSGQFN